MTPEMENGQRSTERMGRMIEENFGPNLARILEALGMSQADLAQKAGLTPAAISQIISGARTPSLKTLIKILRVVPVKFERLVE